jgi:hypothetical protein
VAAIIDLDRGQAGVKQFSPWDDDNVKPRGNLVAAEDLADETFGPVSLD